MGFIAGACLSSLFVPLPNDCKPQSETELPKVLRATALSALAVPADTGPGVARVKGAETKAPIAGDGPVHTPDQSVLRKDFSKQQMNVVAKVRALRDSKRPLTAWQELGIHRTLYVGVVTAKKYLRTRAAAINNTWGQAMTKINFFCPGAGSQEAKGLPVVSMPGVDDSYPPQKKSFYMLKYMHDELINDFDWFLRADDDLYLRPEKLLSFLRTLDAQQNIYMGQPGIGFARDRERLKLMDGEVYCMGGTGVFYTRGALKKLRPYLDECLQQVMSYHEDVEVGRCVSRKAGLQCTWSYEMGKLLYYDVTEKMFNGPQIPSDKKTHQIMNRALTIHPVKKPEMMYAVHAYYTKLQLAEMMDKVELLNKGVAALSRYLPGEVLPKYHQYLPVDVAPPFKPKSRFEVIDWEYFTDKTLYQNVEQEPALGLIGADKADVQTITESARRLLEQRGNHKVRKAQLINGYRRVDPTRGAEYILDMQLQFADGRSALSECI